MDVTEEVTATLRAEAHHPPCVMEAAGFCTEHSANARSIGYEEERSPTLRAGVVPAAIALENHPADSRVKISEDGKVQTHTRRVGFFAIRYFAAAIEYSRVTPKAIAASEARRKSW